MRSAQQRADEHGRRIPDWLNEALKMWVHLESEGMLVAGYTVERLKRATAGKACMGSRKVRSTEPGPAAGRGSDLVVRQSKV
ncbi:MAG: hypothetical protein ACRDPJ_07430 [Nocardioidaceae bacterium]